MPRYVYDCVGCGRVEAVHGFFEDIVCPGCGGPLSRVYTSPAVSFRGAGFTRASEPPG